MKIIYYDSIDSTNEEVKRNIKFLENFTIILSDSQTKGKGRNNRQWYSPKGENLYFSMTIFPEIEIKYFTALPIITGFSVLKTIENFIPSDRIFLKWPNDIIVNEKKICGILVESIKEAIIIGVGINVNSINFPELFENIPTSLRKETGNFFDRLLILKDFFYNFKRLYDKFLKLKKIPEDVLKEINNKLFLKNESVIVEFKEDKTYGKIIGINEFGALILDNNLIYAGDVKKIRKSEIIEVKK